MTQKEIITEITTFCGGRAAEKIVFETVTTGASNDIEKATKLARAMVTQYGMSDEFGLIALESVESRYLDGRPVLYCGEATAARIDDVVMKVIAGCYENAQKLLSENRAILDKLADHLIERETITGKEFMEIYHQFKPEEDNEQTDEKASETKESSEQTTEKASEEDKQTEN